MIEWCRLRDARQRLIYLFFLRWKKKSANGKPRVFLRYVWCHIVTFFWRVVHGTLCQLRESFLRLASFSGMSEIGDVNSSEFADTCCKWRDTICGIFFLLFWRTRTNIYIEYGAMDWYNYLLTFARRLHGFLGNWKKSCGEDFRNEIIFERCTSNSINSVEGWIACSKIYFSKYPTIFIFPVIWKNENIWSPVRIVKYFLSLHEFMTL